MPSPDRSAAYPSRYRTIVADPPWPYEDGFNGFGKRRELPYASMPVADIAALDVPGLAAPGCHLYLWTTNRYLHEALDIAELWGFSYSATLVWAKVPGQKGLGGRFATTTEFVVHASLPAHVQPRRVERAGTIIRAAREAAGLTRAEVFHRVRGGKKTGIVHNWELDISLPNETDWKRLQELLPAMANVQRPMIPPPEPMPRDPYFRHPTSWWQWSSGEHSQKPEAFMDLVEQVSPGPYLEMFARRQRLGWDTWGNEALEHVELSA